MSIELIKTIRFQTGLPLKDIQKAVSEMPGASEEEIITHLRKQGVLKQQARQDKETNQGKIFSYVHDGRIGAMVELRCETDFVSRSEAFTTLGNDIALHLVAFQPKFVKEEDTDHAFIDNELAISRSQLESEGKPADKIEMILQGKKNKILQESALLSQPFLKDESKSVSEVISETVQTTGEKIVVSRFAIFNLNS